MIRCTLWLLFWRPCKRYSELRNSISLQLTVQNFQAVMCYIYCDRAQVIEKSEIWFVYYEHFVYILESFCIVLILITILNHCLFLSMDSAWELTQNGTLLCLSCYLHSGLHLLVIWWGFKLRVHFKHLLNKFMSFLFQFLLGSILARVHPFSIATVDGLWGRRSATHWGTTILTL